jgi:Arylsulfotransferase (ASST)
LPNGNRIMLCQENVITDMRRYVDGGHPAASVTQAIVQEVSPDGMVVFQWRSLDHIPITASYEDLKAAAIRYVHNNSIDVDTDGNLLLSLRHCAAVAKVNRMTGDVMWIMGGKLNQFTFIDEHEENAPTYFSYQHHVIRLPNGNITMFDNGNLRSPQYTRCLEYTIDESEKTARLVWEYRRTPDIFTQLQGAMQTLPNGNRLIAWGSAALNGSPAITEIDPNNTVVFEATSQKDMYFYKASKIPWPYGSASDSVMIAEILEGNTYTYSQPQQNQATGVTITFDDAVFFGYNETVVRRFPFSPLNPTFPPQDGGRAPRVLPMRIDFGVEGIFEHRVQMRLNVDTLGIADMAPFLTVYRRDTLGKGSFTPLTTRFNASSRELIVDSARAGEFCLGIPQRVIPPSAVRLLAPIGGRSVAVGKPVQLRVSPQGRVGTISIQVSRSEDFSDPLVLTPANDYRFTMTPTEQGPYYWRALNTVGTNEAVVSDTAMFICEQEAIIVLEPSVNSTWTRDSSYVVAWKANGGGLLRAEFVKSGEVVSVIRDSVPVNASALLYRVPATVPAGTDYQVRLSAIGSTMEISDVSVARLNIVDGSTSVDEPRTHMVTVMPNPTASTLHVASDVEVSRALLFSLTGELVLDQQLTGKGGSLNVSTISPGTYVLRLQTGRVFLSERVSIVR